MNLGMAQIEVSPGDPEANLSRIIDACEQLKSKNCDWILFPECSDLGWCQTTSPEMASQTSNKFLKRLQGLSHELNIYITCGLSECMDGGIYNSAITFAPEIGIIHKYSKIYELDLAHQNYKQGKKLDVFHTPFGTIGVLICADAFAEHQSLLRSLCYMGADIILSPCAWAVPPSYDNELNPYGALWQDTYQPVANKFKVWIAAVSNVGKIKSGEWAGYECIGCSLLVNSDGEIVHKGPFGRGATHLSVHEVSVVDRPKRGTQWDLPGNRSH